MAYCFSKHLCLLKPILKINNAHLALINNDPPELEPSELEALTIKPQRSFYSSDARLAQLIQNYTKTFALPKHFVTVPFLCLFVLSEMLPFLCDLCGVILLK